MLYKMGLFSGNRKESNILELSVRFLGLSNSR